MKLRIPALLAGILALAGCAADIPYRSADMPADQLASCAPDCTGRPVEQVKVAAVKDDYLLSFVEFDDQGWFQDGSQRWAVFKEMADARAKDPDQQFLIMVYAHGWLHNAGTADGNVAEFQKLLQQIVLMEHAAVAQNMKARPRKVVGVYLGWRGASLTVPGAKFLTFWTRKNAAERVGERSVKQLLMDLEQFKKTMNPGMKDNRLAEPHETQLVMIGHSFGGLVMYHALYSQLMERARHIYTDDGAVVYDVAKSFGDFVLLVNPAFEGSAYEPLAQATRDRCYVRQQRPVMAVVTSQSDWATGITFPLGRAYTALQSAPHDAADERATVFNTVGHLDRYQTHLLRPWDERKDGPPTAAKVDAEPSLDQAHRLVAGAKQVNAALKAGATDPVPLLAAATDKKAYHHLVLERQGKAAMDYMPYLVISADPAVIDGHSDIWNATFRNFMAEFVGTEVMRVKATSIDTPACKPFAKP